MHLTYVVQLNEYFQDLEVEAVLLDEVIENPEKPSKDYLIKLEIKSLRDTRQLLEKVGINEAAQFVEDNRHPRLWLVDFQRYPPRRNVMRKSLYLSHLSLFKIKTTAMVHVTVIISFRRLVAEAALKEMNLNMADACFVRAKDYAKVQFVKKLRDINNDAIRRARVATYFRNFDEAEKIYVEADRRYDIL